MSDGSAVNQVGVWPALNSEATSLETAAELVIASWIKEDGRAVWRTERTETRSSDAEDCAMAPAARAETARRVYCILACVLFLFCGVFERREITRLVLG